MLRINNISVTEKAAMVLHKRRAAFRPRRGDAFALVYMPSFVNADGTIVEEFRPGYAICPLAVNERSPVWVLAQFADEIEFYFMPKFRWSAWDWYLVDMACPSYELFSIGPMPVSG